MTVQHDVTIAEFRSLPACLYVGVDELQHNQFLIYCFTQLITLFGQSGFVSQYYAEYYLSQFRLGIRYRMLKLQNFRNYLMPWVELRQFVFFGF